MKMPKVLHYSWLFLWLALPLKAEVQAVKSQIPANRIGPKILILSADWLGQVPSHLPVNAPEILDSLYPGQKIALALVTEGSDRDSLLNGATVHVKISAVSGGPLEEHDLTPLAARPVEAEGASGLMAVLEGGGVSAADRIALERVVSVASFVIFQPDWSAPSADRAEDIRITAAISGRTSETQLEPTTVRIRPVADWLKDQPGSLDQIGGYLNRYHQGLSPGRLLFLLKSVNDLGGLDSPATVGFFATAYREKSASQDAAIAFFPSLDPKTQIALAIVFRFGGLDISAFLSKLPPPVVTWLKTIGPLKDPRDSFTFQDPISAKAAQEIGATMDECWGAWMATGDRTYLRTLVGLLAGAPDYPAFQSWEKSRGGVQGLNARVARGLAYQIAGWSLISFQRADPLVADWLFFWEGDSHFPPLLRKELAALSTNPAFRQNKP
jgi:hypothetical protein